MMNGAIIGCGYVGTAVAQYWQRQGLRVTVTTTTETRVPELETFADQAVVLSGNDVSGLKTVLADQQVILLSVGAPKAEAYAETYLDTAKTLAQVLPQTNVRQLIYTSSIAVYGTDAGSWVDETSAIAPQTSQAQILAETEATLLDIQDKQLESACQTCILRLGGIYGPGRELVNIVRRMAGTTRPGTGDRPSNWIHLDDIVGAIDFARQQQLQGTYNLVHDRPPTIHNLVTQVCNHHHLPAVTWDSTQTDPRAPGVRVQNRKIKAAGYDLIHPVMEIE